MAGERTEEEQRACAVSDVDVQFVSAASPALVASTAANVYIVPAGSATSAVFATPAATVAPPTKFKRFNYFQVSDEIQLKSVKIKDAHKTQHGKEGEGFDAARKVVINAIPPRVFDTHDKPRLKEIRSRFTLL